MSYVLRQKYEMKVISRTCLEFWDQVEAELRGVPAEVSSTNSSRLANTRRAASDACVAGAQGLLAERACERLEPARPCRQWPWRLTTRAAVPSRMSMSAQMLQLDA